MCIGVLAAGVAIVASAVAPGAQAKGGATPPPPAPAPTVLKLLADPFDPSANPGDVVAQLGSPATPFQDLRQALATLASATDPDAIRAARQLAIDVLEGNPVTGRAYSGLPLLDWNEPSRVRDVPAGGTVVVNEVRFDDRVLTDTSVLRFADPTLPFSIAYHIADLTERGGELAPANVLLDGSAAQPSARRLTLPNFNTGTVTSNRFQTNAAEATRTAIQEVVVPMPAPRLLDAVLDPNITPGHEGMATLLPATPARLAAADALGYPAGTATPTAAQKQAAIDLIGDSAPEKMLWSDLVNLDPSAPDAVSRAAAIGTQDLALVSAMLNHTATPSGLGGDQTADVVVTWLDGQAYTSRRNLYLAPGDSLTVSVVNGDRYARTFAARGFKNRVPSLGALLWGSFGTESLATATLAPGAARTFTLTPSATTFGLWLGDTNRGGQAATVVDLARDALRESTTVDPDFAAAGHGAFDAQGQYWLLLGGMDTVRKITPGATLSAVGTDFPLPGGAFTPTATVPALAPADIAFDQHGVAFVTLLTGNGVARIDPAATAANTSNGITILKLNGCDAAPVCIAPAPLPPPIVPTPPSRNPGQMALMTDPSGNTVIWFAEENADAIGVMVVSPAGAVLATADIPCKCQGPKGIAAAPDGSIWFTADVSSVIGHLRPSPANVVTPAAIDLFPVPSAVTTFIEGTNTQISTAGPHSIAIDQAGRVWFTEEAAGNIAFLDPTLAAPGTSTGITEFAVPPTDFNIPAAPADLVVAGDGTIFFVDEYGDLLATATPKGLGPRWRMTARASKPDKPAIDHNGSLWVAEGAAQLLTRYTAIAVPVRTVPSIVSAPFTGLPAPTGGGTGDGGAGGAVAPAPTATPNPNANPAPAPVNPAPAPSPVPAPAATTGTIGAAPVPNPSTPASPGATGTVVASPAPVPAPVTIPPVSTTVAPKPVTPPSAAPVKASAPRAASPASTRAAAPAAGAKAPAGASGSAVVTGAVKSGGPASAVPSGPTVIVDARNHVASGPGREDDLLPKLALLTTLLVGMVWAAWRLCGAPSLRPPRATDR